MSFSGMSFKLQKCDMMLKGTVEDDDSDKQDCSHVEETSPIRLVGAGNVLRATGRI
jgi:hypothetical protein